MVKPRQLPGNHQVIVIGIFIDGGLHISNMATELPEKSEHGNFHIWQFKKAKLLRSEPILKWMQQKGFHPFPFQEMVWKAMKEGKSGMLQAPTGSGKTLALWLGALGKIWPTIHSKKTGIRVLWITPLRSLSKDTHKALQESAIELGTGWKVAIRNGDTPSSERSRQKKNPPECLIITPESLHTLIAQRNHQDWFQNLEFAFVDEWHDLLGSKRGIQTELALAHLRYLMAQKGERLITWGISATLPNLEQAARVLLGPTEIDISIIRAEVKKELHFQTLFPSKIDRFPWGGRMGLPMLNEVLSVIEESESSLIFTNTRAQTEVWYQNILLFGHDLAGKIAIHHSSLDLEVRRWVEDALKDSKLKAVVCTSSLDLGVDFAPVETIIQIGSPKDVSRILQRAGRSGHGPGRISKVYFVPTHTLELVDAAAIQYAIGQRIIESRHPIQKPLDVLIQWLVTLAIGNGFEEKTAWEIVSSTAAFQQLLPEEWDWVLYFITQGGAGLTPMDEFAKVDLENGLYQVTNKRIARRHLLSIGTIVSSSSVKVKFLNGGFLGTVEESFFTRMKEGEVFWFGGRALEIIRFQPMEVLVKKAVKGKGVIPSWGGGRMSLSTTFSELIRLKMGELASGKAKEKELTELAPLVEIQNQWSLIPSENEFLVEYFKTRDGFHFCFYPFEGRYINEILASLVGYRIARTMPISFSIGMNDYGFELLSDQEIDPQEMISLDLFSSHQLEEDLNSSINIAELSRRKFRDIASISGLVFNGFPGVGQTNKHLQSSAQLIFDTLLRYEPDHPLLKQAQDEVLDFSVEQSRLLQTLERIANQKIRLTFPPQPTPLAFPIMVDRLREKLSSESLEQKVERLSQQLENLAKGKKLGTKPMEHSRTREGLEKRGLI